VFQLFASGPLNGEVKNGMKITVIVPTYNRPLALKLCLLSLAQQSVLPHEVMIADDGSGPETREMVLHLQERLRQAFPIHHVWHEDRGFRKPMILNETVRQSTGEYLVFIDGDSMAHRHFVRAHVSVGSPDAILSGKRVEIGRALTERLLAGGRVLNSLGPRLVWDSFRGGSRKVEEALIIRSPFLRKLSHRDRITDDGVWGCNFSLSKDLFIAINGCDEDFLDGSIEDNDLGIRVLNQGKRVRSVRGLAVIFHLWHKSSWSFENEKYQHNLAILKRRIANREPFCRNGIRKL
jgi:glycosyltransferase involved in cell wall biosynthesis